MKKNKKLKNQNQNQNTNKEKPKNSFSTVDFSKGDLLYKWVRLLL
jgi:hypothetical protein